MKKISQAKALLTFLATEYIVKSNTEMGRLFQMTPTATGQARIRGIYLAEGFNVGSILKVSYYATSPFSSVA